jgi:excisionase family DNA binding protein
MLQNQTSVPQEYLSIAIVARILGLSERKVHMLIHDEVDPIPHCRIGRKILRIKKSDLEAWMNTKRNGNNGSPERQGAA